MIEMKSLSTEALLPLVENISSHAALNNRFYPLWMSKQLSSKHIGVFARNYLEFTRCFPESLAILIQNIDDVLARTEYVKTLYSEMGYGKQGKAHATLFENFWHDLFVCQNEENVWSARTEVPILNTTIKFIKGQQALYGGEQSIAAGAQLALEWQAYSMVMKLYEGARNYRSLWPDDERFHESCEFFYVHIGEAEKEHKVESLLVASKFAERCGNVKKIEQGFYEHLDLIALFWNGIADEIKA